MSDSESDSSDELPEPLMQWIEELIDIENVEGMRLVDRVPIPDISVDPIDLLLVPPPFMPYTLDLDRDLEGNITNAFERYSPSQEALSYTACLLYGQAPQGASYKDCDLVKDWSSIPCKLQQFSDSVLPGVHWADDEEPKRDVLAPPSLSNPVDFIHLSDSKTISVTDRISEGDERLLATLGSFQGNHLSSAFFSHLRRSGDLDGDPHSPDRIDSDDLSPDEADTSSISDALSELAVRRGSSSRNTSINAWKSITKKFDPNEFEPIRPNLVMNWPFELDDFQKQAIVELEKGNSVFVAAHTSAGKTVVAEYAIALTRQHGTRCIYCSPIKALSNQKYRELKEKFDEVGLVTGDIRLRPDAFFVIMTTEILRSMVYNSSEVIHELEWLIFDEVHYVNDLERGVVWEEILILIPPHVKFVMLSATVPNAIEFADWVGHTKRRQVSVISTASRPVALQHFLYLPSGDMFMLRSGEGQFLINNYKDAVALYRSRYRTRPSGKRSNLWVSFVQNMKSFELLPLIIFVFSRNLCDEMANTLNQLDLLGSEDKVKVRNFRARVMKMLDEEDRSLQQVQFVTDLSENGIGVHHSGLLPILKEYVEILFANGLIKVLVATETFAMGVNMPARTVVFSNIRKFDGVSRRNLHAGEYTQMSGRAGRRGLDTSGAAIIVCDSAPPASHDLIPMLQGAPLTLLSKFRLTFAICLKISRTVSFSMLKMLRNSFSEFSGAKQALLAAHDYEQTERSLTKQRDFLVREGPCPVCGADIELFVKKCAAYWVKKRELDPHVLNAFQNSRYNHPGRLIYVQATARCSMVPAVIVDPIRSSDRFVHVIVRACEWSASDEVPSVDSRFNSASKQNDDLADGDNVSCDELSWLPGFSIADDDALVCPLRIKEEDGSTNIRHDPLTVVFAELPINRIQAFSKRFVRTEFRMHEYRDPHMNRTRWRKMRDGSIIRHPSEYEMYAQRCAEFLSRPELLQWDRSSFLDVAKDLGMRDYQSCMEERELRCLLADIIQSVCVRCPKLMEHFNRALRIWCCEERMHRLRAEMSDERLELLGEYKQRLNFLEELGYMEASPRIALTCKGHAACLVNEKEIVLVELLCSKMILRSCQREQADTDEDTDKPDPLGPYPIASLAAILSTLVCTARSDGGSSTAEALEPDAQPAMDEYLLLISELDSKLCRHDLTQYQIKPTLNMTLCQLVYRWTMGDSFASCMTLTNQQEGIVVKCIQRISDLCKEMQKAARYLTCLEMVHRLELLRSKIQRGVVFTNSLYSES